MRRINRVGAWGCVLASAMAVPVAARDDAPPPLTLPGDVTPPILAPVPDPIRPTPPKPPATAWHPLRPSTNLLRPLDATVPATVPAASTLPPPEGEAVPAFPDAPPPMDGPPDLPASPFGEGPSLLDGPPPLDGPAEMRPSPSRPTIRNPSIRRLPMAESRNSQRLADDPPALTLEANSEDDLDPLPDSGAGDADRIEPRSRPDASPAPKRRFGLFAPFSSRTRPQPRPESSVRVEPRSDPAADAALKRRLEAKVEDAVGDRARDIEVRVVDRNVVVRAHVDRFWNRRGVRRVIETLPALAGYRTVIQVD